MTPRATPTPMPTFALILRPTLASELIDMAVAVAVDATFAAAGLVVPIDENDVEADPVVGDDVGVEPDSMVGFNVDEGDMEAVIEVGDDVDVEPHSVAGVDVGKEVVIASSDADHVVAGRSDLQGILQVSIFSLKNPTLGGKVCGRRTAR